MRIQQNPPLSPIAPEERERVFTTEIAPYPNPTTTFSLRPHKVIPVEEKIPQVTNPLSCAWTELMVITAVSSR